MIPRELLSKIVLSSMAAHLPPWARGIVTAEQADHVLQGRHPTGAPILLDTAGQPAKLRCFTCRFWVAGGACKVHGGADGRWMRCAEGGDRE